MGYGSNCMNRGSRLFPSVIQGRRRNSLCLLPAGLSCEQHETGVNGHAWLACTQENGLGIAGRGSRSCLSRGVAETYGGLDGRGPDTKFWRMCLTALYHRETQEHRSTLIDMMSTS